MIQELHLSKEENVFLIPEMPTPNGRMHLGHISGPYLKLDVVKRKVTRNGALAYLISGVDVFESYVELKAHENASTEEEVSNEFYKLICDDFKALDIDFDMFINPLDDEHRVQFKNQQLSLYNELKEKNAIDYVLELFSWDPVKMRYLTGCWIKGKCNVCKEDTGSYLCESCGTHYKPSDIFSKDVYTEALLLQKKSSFLKLNRDKIMEHLSKTGVPADFQAIVQKYFDVQGNTVRISTRQKTGIQIENREDHEVLYTYTTLWFFSLYCADILHEKLGLDTHPFNQESTFKTVASFGIDNAIPYLCGVLGAGQASDRYRPFDFLLPNYFYYLDGKKFSTSRQHVIWASDIVSIGKIPSDLVRYYLALRNPDKSTTNFDPTDFVNISNNLGERINNILVYLDERKDDLYLDQDFPKSWMNKLSTQLEKQNKALDLSSFNLELVCESIDDWLDFFERDGKQFSPAEKFWWLRSFALIAYPIMPTFTSNIYEILLGHKSIRLDRFFSEPLRPEISLKHLYIKRINLENLRLCMKLN